MLVKKLSPSQIGKVGIPDAILNAPRKLSIDGRASSSYILWIDDKAKLLVDMGSGSMLRFEQSKAKLEDLEAVVLTHLHIDHSVDLPSFIKGEVLLADDNLKIKL